MSRIDAALAGILENSPDDIPICVRVYAVDDADLERLETLLRVTSDIAIHDESGQRLYALRATAPQIKELASNDDIRRIEFDVAATDEPAEEMPPGGRAAERYREFISGRYPDDVSLLGDPVEDQPDPDSRAFVEAPPPSCSSPDLAR